MAKTFMALLLTATLLTAPIAVAVTLGPEGSGSDVEFKIGVEVEGPITLALPAIVAVWKLCSAGTPIVTSGNDSSGVHKPGSYHGQRRALDLRGRSLSRNARACILSTLPGMLPEVPGERWVLLWEEYPELPARNHFHLHLKL